MCSKWIIDRLPTAEDADEDGSVIAWIDDCWSAMSWRRVVDEGLPWMLPPEPYAAPIDTSLAASIERMEKLSMQIVHTDQFCDDFNRIIEAAKRWDDALHSESKGADDPVTEKERRIYYQDLVYKICNVLDQWDGKTTQVGSIESPEDEAVEKCKQMLSAAKLGLRESDCPDVLVVPHKRKPLDIDGPSNGSEPGASGSNDPPPFAGSSRSVGEAELPDPGEGWELCSKNKGEQWCIVLAETQNEWLDGTNKLADFHRRRVVVTEPPDKTHYESDVWYYGKLERQWFWGTAGSVRSCWKNGITAWCHRLDGEDTPPQFALDWGKDRNE